MISNDEPVVDVEVLGMVAATSSLRPWGNGSDSMESCVDEEGLGLGIGIGIAVVVDAVSEMENRLDKGLCGSDDVRDAILVGDVERDFRSKMDGECDHSWKDLGLGGL